MEEYLTVTELPGYKASKEQYARLYNRYRFALPFCEDKEVLEIACGGGMGLGYLARAAKRVVAGDIDKKILKYPLEYYKGRDKIEIKELDAHHLPFENKSFDVIILYEAIYYLNKPEMFVSEAYRVLRDNGVLLICTVNKDWIDFNPSPYSTEYLSAPELYSLLKKKFFRVELFAAFPVSEKGIKNKAVSLIKRLAKTLNIMPKTMKGKEFFKRIFFGKLITLPEEVEDGQVEYSPPVSIPGDYSNHRYKILYSAAYV